MRIRHLRVRGKHTEKGWIYTLTSYLDMSATGYAMGESRPVRISRSSARALVGWIDIGKEDDWEAHVTVTYT